MLLCLHNFYRSFQHLKYLSDVRLLKLKREHEYKTLLRDKFEYYTGKSDPSVYQEKPFDLKGLGTRVEKYNEVLGRSQFNFTRSLNSYRFCPKQ